MSSLIQETEQELMKHFCKLCDKSFPSGRSLGGHMRSHVINSTVHHHQKQMKKLSTVNNGGKSMKNTTTAVFDGSSNSNDSGYELRKDPKKTPKVNDSSEVENKGSCLVVLDKLCKECGKGFQSWKALFGHMKCHSEKVLNNHNLNQDSWTSQTDNENSAGRIKKSRSRIKRYITATVTTTTITTASSSISMTTNTNNNNSQMISSNHASTSVVSEIEQDQESEIAMCLMMLSRDDGKWGDEFESSDHCNSSALVRLTKVEGKKPVGIKKLAETQVGVDYLGRSGVGSTGLEKIMIHNDEFNDESELGFGKIEDSSKRKFECATCNTSFHSYQALGGHKASHKKLKGCLDPKIGTIESKPMFNHEHMNNGYSAKPSDNHQATKGFNLGAGSLKKKVLLGSHECPICFKIFSSGQALGGHKRSHIIAEAKLNQQTSMNLIEKVNEPIRGFLDLNMLPDTMEEEMMMMNNSHEYKPWYWTDSTNHESTTLLGLLSS